MVVVWKLIVVDSMPKVAKLRGQSLVEVVVSIGLIGLVITGVVVLMVNTLAVRTRGFDRKKATELASKVTETVLNDKLRNPTVFWNLDGANHPTYWDNWGNTMVDNEFPGYNYIVTWRWITENSGIGASCTTGTRYICTEMTVDVGVSGMGPEGRVKYSRFFSR